MIKYFCKICNKEMWESLMQDKKETTTIAEAEETLICTDCQIKAFKEA